MSRSAAREISSEVTACDHTLRLRSLASTSAVYQVVFRYHEPGEYRQPQEPLSIEVVYEDRKPRAGDSLQATATVKNQMQETAPMVMIELPIPAGFRAFAEDFDRLVEKGAIAKFQLQPTRVLVYLRELAAGKTQTLSYRLHAQMAVDVRVPPARVYEYYNPERQGFSTTTRLVVAQGP